MRFLSKFLSIWPFPLLLTVLPKRPKPYSPSSTPPPQGASPPLPFPLLPFLYPYPPPPPHPRFLDPDRPRTLPIVEVDRSPRSRLLALHDGVRQSRNGGVLLRHPRRPLQLWTTRSTGLRGGRRAVRVSLRFPCKFHSNLGFWSMLSCHDFVLNLVLFWGVVSLQ